MRSPDKMPTLKRWLPYAAELGRDAELYQHHPDYLYPPFFLVLLHPLTGISPVAAAVIWQLSKYACLAVIFTTLWRLFGDRKRLPAWVMVGSVLLSVRFFASDLGHGNVNIFICLLVVLGLWGVTNRRPMVGGLLVALAACIKVTPALWGVYLAYKRRWRACIGFALGMVLALEVAPLAVVSPTTNHALLAGWYRSVVSGRIRNGQPGLFDADEPIACGRQQSPAGPRRTGARRILRRVGRSRRSHGRLDPSGLVRPDHPRPRMVLSRPSGP